MINSVLSKDELIELFQSVGVKPGMILEVHTSLSKFGYCIGGAQTFNDALIELLGYSGTIIMPLQAGSRSEPSYFKLPPMEASLYSKYRSNMPAFDCEGSDSEHMGVVVENLRRRPKAVVAYHPTCSFVAYGKYAKLLCSQNNINYSLSDRSALGRLYELKAHCLLAGVGYDKMTSLHLSEYRSGVRPIILQGSAIKENNQTVWKKYMEIDVDSDDGFDQIGKSLEAKNLVSIVPIAKGELRLLRVDVAVDEGMHYFDERLKYYRY